MTLEQLVALLLTTALGWLGAKIRAVGGLEVKLETSRASQGSRLGLLEDRVARLEGRLGLAPPEGKEQAP